MLWLMEETSLIESLRSNAAAWLLLMFLGVLYWAFWPRLRRKKERKSETPDDP